MMLADWLRLLMLLPFLLDLLFNGRVLFFGVTCSRKAFSSTANLALPSVSLSSRTLSFSFYLDELSMTISAYDFLLAWLLWLACASLL